MYVSGSLIQLATCTVCTYKHVQFLGVKETSLMDIGSSSNQSNNTSSSVEGTYSSYVIL